MTTDKINYYRALAKEHERGHRSAKIILECLDEIELGKNEIERLKRLYSIALDAAYKSARLKNMALSKLQRLAE